MPTGVRIPSPPESSAASRRFPVALSADRQQDAEFIAAPDWYYNFEYPQEIKRGYDGYEDLLTTGYFLR